MEYKSYNKLDLPKVSEEIRKFWEQNDVFKQSISSREGNPNFTFYEGPPSVNGLPGIHHVLGRTVKDIFCRYKTLQGFQVKRKSGWDTHGLPVELQVEKRLGLKKGDIGNKISVEDYNKECRTDVLKYKGAWEEMTAKLGFWLDFDDVYITYDKNYIETLWYLLKELFDKDLLYQDYSIQPYSPAAGTALSSHELNQPGAYRSVKDVSMTAQFKLKGEENTYLMAWTTTPWTLPSNTGLAVGKNIDYLKIETLNPYTGQHQFVYLAEAALEKYFDKELENKDFNNFEKGGKEVPFKVIEKLKGEKLAGKYYDQLMPYVQPENGDPFRVFTADFVTTEEGTGIVHIAPTFGDDDFKAGKENNIPPLTITDPDNTNKRIPLVDKEGRFVDEVTDFARRFVKNYEAEPSRYEDVNVDIAVKLKKENKAFKIEKYDHNYPHCWRTDRPILYYPIEAWFIRTTTFKDRLRELNNTINWKPESTGEGRFGHWLDNMVDWNLSRTRYWGTPLPVWKTENGDAYKCIGSYEELKKEVNKAIESGIEQEAISDEFDPHRPYVDRVILVSEDGRPMKRVEDVIDVWFDSGAMPYAQWHYPFENKDIFKKNYPADFIAEGVDQTRGWFYTLHAIAGMLFDSVAYKNVIANGLVLDKDGNKMSKRLGNAVDPIKTLDEHGSDATRWYMVHNAQLWENLKFDLKGVDETKKKFFGTLYNTYSFFALYANIDEFKYSTQNIPVNERPEIDRWVLSLLNTLIDEVEHLMDDYEPTRTVRKIQSFVIDHLSNWYVRLCRRRFWKGEMSEDKLAAYQTLYTCLSVVSKLMAPFAPFYADRLFQDLNSVSQKEKVNSVHLSDFPKADGEIIDKDLEERMAIAQNISSQALALRKKAKIRVRQPLNRIMVPVLNDKFKTQLEKIDDLIKSEINVKEVQPITETEGVLVKKVKPDFKKLGPKFGPKMKLIHKAVSNLDQSEISDFEENGRLELELENEKVNLELDDVEILTEDIPGWLVSTADKITVALDVNIDEELEKEGIAREIVNRVQNLRKEKGFEVTDHIELEVEESDDLSNAINEFKDYICSEILADSLDWKKDIEGASETIDIEGKPLNLTIKKS